MPTAKVSIGDMIEYSHRVVHNIMEDRKFVRPVTETKKQDSEKQTRPVWTEGCGGRVCPKARVMDDKKGTKSFAQLYFST